MADTNAVPARPLSAQESQRLDTSLAIGLLERALSKAQALLEEYASMVRARELLAAEATEAGGCELQYGTFPRVFVTIPGGVVLESVDAQMGRYKAAVEALPGAIERALKEVQDALALANG